MPKSTRTERSAKPKRERIGEYVGFRSPQSLKKKLEDAAARANRSLSSEAQFRLEESFRAEDGLLSALRFAYGDRVAGLVLLLGQALNDTGISCLPADASIENRKKWIEDPYAFDQAIRALNSILERVRPAGEIVIPEPPRGLEKTKHDILHALRTHRGTSIANELGMALNGKRPEWNDRWLATIADMLGPQLTAKLEPRRLR